MSVNLLRNKWTVPKWPKIPNQNPQMSSNIPTAESLPALDSNNIKDFSNNKLQTIISAKPAWEWQSDHHLVDQSNM